MRQIGLFFTLLLLPTFLTAQSYEWSPLARKAFDKVLELRLVEAKSLCEDLAQQEPKNLIRHHVENYIDFFTVFLNEDRAEFDRLEANKEKRLDAIERGPSDSPWQRYLLADIRLQWALARLKFEEYGTAFFEVNKAFKLLERNQKLHPYFMPNKKDLGILHAIVGTIPDNYKWAVEWLSAAEGTIQQGQEELEEVLAYCEGRDFIFETETYVLYGYLMLHFRKNSERAWEVIKNSPLDARSNPLAAFIQANIGMRIGKNDEAIQILQHRPKSRAFHPFPYLEFMHGTALQRKLDPQASIYFQRYIDRFTGQNFIKEAYQKMAWSALIQGDLAGYQLHMQSCSQRGYLLTGSDESAQREAESGLIPNADLLKGRLLFDGGYYQQAHQQLSLLGENHFHSDTEKVEYWYRLGRVQQERKQHQEALKLLQKAIDKGRELPEYYACRAALEAGHIYELMGQRSKAKEYFNTCLDIKPAEHRSALHQAAKAGLNRLSS